MKKTYCDRCGREMEQNGNILLRKEMGDNHLEDYFDICDKCRDAFFGWLNNKPVEQEKLVKQAKPVKKMFPTWATIKQLAAIFCQSERRMSRMMARLKADRRKIKNGRNWWYEYKISQNIYKYLCNELGA